MPFSLSIFYSKAVISNNPLRFKGYFFLPDYLDKFSDFAFFEPTTTTAQRPKAVRFYKPSPFVLNYLFRSYPMLRFKTDGFSKFFTSYSLLPKPYKFPILPLAFSLSQTGEINSMASLTVPVFFLMNRHRISTRLCFHFWHFAISLALNLTLFSLCLLDSRFS